MKKALIVIGLIVAASSAQAQVLGTGSNPNDHYVSPYTRSDGTSVQGHYQTNPNSTRSDNYGTAGNYNPHTGRYGTRN